MSRDTILTDSDGVRYSYDNLRTQSWLEGHTPGAEEAVVVILEKAVSLFREGHHQKAIEMQNLAKEIEEKVTHTQAERSKRHGKEYPIVLPPLPVIAEET